MVGKGRGKETLTVTEDVQGESPQRHWEREPRRWVRNKQGDNTRRKRKGLSQCECCWSPEDDGLMEYELEKCQARPR